jgi:hypothetical protein
MIAGVLQWCATHPQVVEAIFGYASVMYYFYLNFRERQPPKNSRWQYVLWALRERLLVTAWEHPGLGLKRRWPKLLGSAPDVSAPPPLEPPNETTNEVQPLGGPSPSLPPRS